MRWARAGALALSLVATSSVADEKAASQRPAFGADVAIVTLPVFVKNKSGQPITGLKAEDFQVSDDGQIVNLVGFQEVDTRAAPPASVLAGPTSSATRRQFLLLFDLTFTSVAGLRRAVRRGWTSFNTGLGLRTWWQSPNSRTAPG